MGVILSPFTDQSKACAAPLSSTTALQVASKMPVLWPDLHLKTKTSHNIKSIIIHTHTKISLGVMVAVSPFN